MQVSFLKISKSEIPCEKTFFVGGTEYVFRFLYNDMFDFYTVTVSNMDGSLVSSGKLSYAAKSLASAGLGWDLFPVSEKEFSREAPLYGRLGGENFDDCMVCII